MPNTNENIESGGSSSSVPKISSGDYNDNLLTSMFDMMQNITAEIKTMRKDLEALREDNKRISLSISSQEKYFKKNCRELKNEIFNLRQEMINDKNEILALKQATKQNLIKISNFPVSENEDPFTIFEKVCKYIKFSVNVVFIEDCYRLSSKNSVYTPLIIVKFLRNKDKMSFLKILRENKVRLTSQMIEETLPNTQIYISEYLIPEMAAIFREARNMKKSNLLKFVWVRNGKIFVKISESSRPLLITSKEDLSNITKPKTDVRGLLGDEAELDESDATDISESSTQSKRKRTQKIPRTSKIGEFFRPHKKAEK